MSGSTGNMAMPSGQRTAGSHAAPLAAHYPRGEHGGAVSLPMVDSSTYVFKSALHGKIAFAMAYGLQAVLDQFDPDGTIQEELKASGSLIYARLSTPTIAQAEASMLALEHGADWAMLFPSGMAAITSLVVSTCHLPLPGNGPLASRKRDIVLHSTPVYGGTHALFNQVMPGWGFTNVEVDMNDPDALRATIEMHRDRIGLVYLETPANPTCTMVDIRRVADVLADMFDENARPTLAVDNTFAGIFCSPLELGADVAVYSATKYLGGHADLIAGFMVGKNGRTVVLKHFDDALYDMPFIEVLKRTRTVCGFTPSPEMAQKLWKHMQTYTLRMTRQAEVATRIAHWLHENDKIEGVYFPTLLTGEAAALYKRQMTGPSAMIAFKIKDTDEAGSFRFLDALRHISSAVSLGATRTLANHPAAWTHSDVSPEDQLAMGITDNLIRLSVGIEEPELLIADLDQALAAV